jgi:hypothetical protein
MIAFIHTAGALVIDGTGRRVFHRFPPHEPPADHRRNLARELIAHPLFAGPGGRPLPAEESPAKDDCAPTRSPARSDSERIAVPKSPRSPVPGVSRLAEIHGDAARFDRGIHLPL